jgi:hypothetical protein
MHTTLAARGLWLIPGCRFPIARRPPYVVRSSEDSMTTHAKRRKVTALSVGPVTARTADPERRLLL